MDLASSSSNALDSSNESKVIGVKVFAMVGIFLEVQIFGNIPIRVKAFKSNQLVLALAQGFSGGLFISVGIIHILPDAVDSFTQFYKSKHTEDDNHFPWPYLITVLAFTMVIFIEKMVTKSVHSHEIDFDENTGKKENPVSAITNKDGENDLLLAEGSNIENSHIAAPNSQENIDIHDHDTNNEHDHEHGHHHHHHENEKLDAGKWRPYILQLAIGIHSIFEGMAIGLVSDWLGSLSITIAVMAHNWAHSMTLGIAYRKADINLTSATLQILLQGFINPLGIGIGWALTTCNQLVQGVFLSISVGTFLYIADIVIIEEFELERYMYLKSLFFTLAIGFIVGIYFVEQAAGG